MLRQAGDRLLFRSGDGSPAAPAFVGKTALSLGTQRFAMANIPCDRVWLAPYSPIGQAHRTLVPDEREDRTPNLMKSLVTSVARAD